MLTSSRSKTRVIGFAGWSGAGKTTLITKLIPVFRSAGISVSTLKHAHHGFDIDRPGKDSYEHREAGAQEVLIASSRRWALMHESRDEPEMALADLLTRLSPVDLVIIEGFKTHPYPKIEVHRAASEKPLIAPNDPYIMAIAADCPLNSNAVPVVSLDDISAIAALVDQFAAPLDETLSRMRGIA